MNKADVDELEYKIEVAKYDNAARYLEVPGSQMTPAQLANIGFRGNILDIMGNSITLMRRLQDPTAPPHPAEQQ